MTLFDITLKSLKRQFSKKLFLLFAMALSITTVFTMYIFTKSQTYKIESQFDEYGANIVITPKTDYLSLNYGGVSFSEVVSLEEIERSELQSIKSIKDINSIRAISPKLIGAVTVKTEGVEEMSIIVGTDFSAAFMVNGWWDSEIELPENENDIFIGYDVADKLNIAAGDDIFINDEVFHVVRILAVAGNQDDQAIIANIEAVERLLGRSGKATLVEVSALCTDCPIDELVTQISEVLPGANVRALKEVMVQRMEVVGQIERFALTISIILMLLCSLLIFSNMASSVNERRHEIGIYRAIGFSKGDIISIIQYEALIITVFASLLGLMFSLLLSYYGLPQFTDIERDKILIDQLFLFKGIIVVTLLGSVSSLLPAINAANSDPVRTINSL